MQLGGILYHDCALHALLPGQRRRKNATDIDTARPDHAVRVRALRPRNPSRRPGAHRCTGYFISGNWAGEPLSSYETMLKFIRTTKTTRGLRIRATLVEKQYQKGIKVLDSQMAEISLKRSRVNPNWNYSIAPN
jgi:hypothetical protein